MDNPPCPDCWQLVEEKQELRDKLTDHREVERQAYRQIGLYLEGGDRNCLIVAQAILDPTGATDG